MSTLRGKSVHFSDTHLNIELNDGRIISTPIDWYPELQNATVRQLKTYRFICRGTGIEWEMLDYQLSIESMLSSNSIAFQKAIA